MLNSEVILVITDTQYRCVLTVSWRSLGPLHACPLNALTLDK